MSGQLQACHSSCIAEDEAGVVASFAPLSAGTATNVIVRYWTLGRQRPTELVVQGQVVA